MFMVVVVVMFVMMLFTFFMVVMVMFMTFGSDHCVRFFLCGQSTYFLLNPLSFIMVTVIGKGTVHEIQDYIRNPFNLRDLAFQLRGTIGTVNPCNLKFVCRCFVMFMIMFRMFHKNTCLI